MPHFMQPVLIVVAQGRKVVHISGRDYAFAGNTCFVTGVNMPVTSCVLEASEDQPYLAMSLYLDMELLAELAVRTPPQGAQAECPCGAMIQEMGPELLDAFVRLAALRGIKAAILLAKTSEGGNGEVTDADIVKIG